MGVLFEGICPFLRVCEHIPSPSETDQDAPAALERIGLANLVLIDAFDESVDLRSEMTLQQQVATALAHSGSWSCVWPMLARAAFA